MDIKPISDIKPTLCRGLERMHIADAREKAEKLEIYAQRLIRYNEKVNLTAITKPEEIATKHFLDCAACAYLIPEGAYCADIGTGAGFPGMVLALVRPDIEMVLFDSLKKRLAFLEELSGELGIKAKCVHARAEDAGASPMYREKFDVALSRAVARMSVLSELTLPFVKKGGILLALKGPDAGSELADAARAIKLLGGGTPTVEPSGAFDGQQHNFVIIRKVGRTPAGYPRKAGLPAKNPIV